MKTCRSCYQAKPDDGFYHLRSKFSDKRWLSNDCIKCKNVQDHQRVLNKELEKGRAIINCDRCDLLMRKVNTRKICLKCIRESCNE